nr:MAG TPA: hypothetical protein [Caudoviricetes sp.]
MIKPLKRFCRNLQFLLWKIWANHCKGGLPDFLLYRLIFKREKETYGY